MSPGSIVPIQKRGGRSSSSLPIGTTAKLGSTRTDTGKEWDPNHSPSPGRLSGPEVKTPSSR